MSMGILFSLENDLVLMFWIILTRSHVPSFHACGMLPVMVHIWPCGAWYGYVYLCYELTISWSLEQCRWVHIKDDTKDFLCLLVLSRSFYCGDIMSGILWIAIMIYRAILFWLPRLHQVYLYTALCVFFIFIFTSLFCVHKLTSVPGA